MPVVVSDLKILKTYLRGVIGKAKHHAPDVEEIVLALAGAVISRQGAVPLEVRSAPSGGMGLTLTFTSTKRRRYCLSYNHTARCVDLKDKSFLGPVLHSFTNATPISTVAAVFATL